MKVKNSNLEWYVLRSVPPYDTVEKYNALTGAGVAEALHKKVRKKEVYDKKTLRDFLINQFRYYFWSKTECEILVSDLSGRNVQKIDIFTQLMMNLDNIVEYINIKCDLKF